MNRNSSTTGRLKGIFLRGKKYWYRYSYDGHQYRVPLDTTDEGAAVTKALKIRENPLLAGACPIKEEIKNYLQAKRDDATYTRNSAESREAVLNSFVRDRRIKEVREITESEIKVLARLPAPSQRSAQRGKHPEVCHDHPCLLRLAGRRT